MNGSLASQFREINWTLLYVRTWNLLSYYLSAAAFQAKKTGYNLLASFRPDLYVFYEGVDIPVKAQDYGVNSSGASTVRAIYNRDTKQLTMQSAQSPYHMIGILDAQIYHNEVMLYSLDDFFVNTLYSQRGTGVPPLSLWISIWCLESATFLDRNKDFTLRVTYMDGSEDSYSLWSRDEVELSRWQEKNRQPTPLHHQALVSNAAAAASAEAEAPLEPDNQGEDSKLE